MAGLMDIGKSGRNLISSGANSQNALFDNRDAILDELSNYISFSVSLSNNGGCISKSWRYR